MTNAAATRPAVDVIEVSPRDGLQNEPVILPTSAKLELIRRAIEAGARRIEAVSFVRPDTVPAMADADEIMGAVPRLETVAYAGLVLNARGYQRALTSGVDEVNVVVPVTDTFSQRNQNSDTEGLMSIAEEIAQDCASHRLPCTITFAVAFGCPFEGDVPHDRVIKLAQRAIDAGASEIALADTIGVGVPEQVRSFVTDLDAALPSTPIRMHFHNTRNTGYANAAAAVELGVTRFDASIGGIGGCPFAPKATGNIATEDLVYMLERGGRHTGLSLQALIDAAVFLEAELGRPVPALLPKAGPFPTSAAGGDGG